LNEKKTAFNNGLEQSGTDLMNSLLETQKSRGHTVLVVFAAFGLTVATLALVVVMARSSYQSTLDAARQNARFESSLVAGQMGMVLVDIENSLTETGRLLAVLHDLPPRKRNDQLREALASIQRKKPYIQSMFITDAQGKVISWTGPGVAPDISDRDYVVAHRGKEAGFFIGKPILSRVRPNTWVFGVSLGLRDRHGELTHGVGAVVAMLPLLEIFERVEMPRGTHIMITDMEGLIYLHAPNQKLNVGHAVPEIKQHAQNLPGKTFTGVSPVDHMQIVAGNTHVAPYPLLAFAGFPREMVLAPWKKHAMVYGGASIVLVLVVATLGTFLVRSQVRLNRQSRALALAASTDLLTGALNRRAFMDAASREFARVCRYGGRLACIMIDLDHFKNINDTYGHAAGDLVLSSTAHHIASRLREPDLFCRFGGEEFVILLPGTDQDGAATVAEELRAGLSAMNLEHEKKKLPLTASFGVAVISDQCTTLDALILLADQALYKAKESGRDRVCCAPAPPRT
jgi:diguanylate cyclase (GGDEF)-like protein